MSFPFLVLHCLCSALDELGSDKLKRFKLYLSERIMEGFEPIPRGQLEQCDATEIASKMKEVYGEDGAVKLTLTILRMMSCNVIADRLQESITSAGQ
ncbi:apoptosis-associated speck-like protein containing a CARD [Engraulis encrasicolus]|uniref:apoptosis-associated speck-like protein containing a CARD n=1 Tax=Engraulis encrasicolus TaxID=184585 RepID=UPI002FD09317